MRVWSIGLLLLLWCLTLSCAKKATHPSATVVGRQLAWRALRSRAAQPAVGWLSYTKIYVDNFDSDPDDEVLLVQATGDELIDLSSSAAPISGTSLSIGSFMECWDFDGDGIADLLGMVEAPSATNASAMVDVMAVYSVTGQALGFVRGNPMGPTIARGDFNGDGRVDLLMSAESPYSADPTIPAQAFDVNGVVLFTAPPDWNSPYVTVGDTDNDKCDEVVSIQNGQSVAFGIDGQAQPFTAWNNHFPQSHPAWFADLNGDGVDEAVSSDGAVLDYVNNTTWQLELPAGWPHLYVDGTFGPSIFSGTFPGNSGQCVVATPAEEGIDTETFVIWQGDGKLVYCEYFGEIIEAIGLASTPAGDHVVLVTKSSVLIWP